MSEEALLLGKDRTLVGIITDPQEYHGNNLPAVILLNAGIVHRVGPNRLYVQIARSLAGMGFVVLRLDYSGIGDSKARDDNCPFEKSVISETQEAMNWLSTMRDIKQFILIGLCSATAFRTASCDQRVVGGVLINTLLELRHHISDELISYILNRKIARKYWKVELFNPKGWLKIIKGKASYRRIINALGFQMRSLFTHRMSVPAVENRVSSDLRLLVERGVNLLLIYSEGGTTLDYLRLTLGKQLDELGLSGKLRIEIIQQADHTFTLLRHQEQLLRIICNWAHEIAQEK